VDGVEAVRLTTDRLVLRPWRDEDREPFAELCADPVVMQHFPSVLNRAAAEAQMDIFAAELDERGYAPWAVEVKGGPHFVGFVGLHDAEAVLGRPAVEVGWRLAAAHWGHGYAPEGARECLRYAFEALGLDEVVSFTVPANANSRRVMEKIGLTLVDEFDHPRLAGSRHQRHVLYRITVDDWRAGTG
jgi:RimJ/RimL family protein N-acetyltransferase